MITVFTPTYNRATLLSRLYNSLKIQKYTDFEWLIVDDGSTDNTEQTIKDIIKNHKQDFCVRYFKVNNGGKHRAINYGVKNAKGKVFFIVDSDDWLPENALADVAYYFSQIENDDSFAGVAGLKQSNSINFKEQTFSGEYLDATSLQRKNYGIYGEKAEVFKIDILKRFPFPEYDGENFISEAIVWDKIAFEGFKLRWFNKCVYIYEYQEGGLTLNLFKKYKESPIGYLTYLKQEMYWNKESLIKRYMFYGRGLHIVKGSSLSLHESRKILGINLFQCIIAKLIWKGYSLTKRKK